MLDSSDTIVAVSSPPGQAARGIIRLSGPDAIRIAAGCFAGSALAVAPPLTRLPGSIAVGRGGVPAVACVFRKPHSYTRDDLVELHLTGSPGVLALLLDDLVARGARPAGPGEFTARAFLAGAMDLAEAQGVAALIAAQSDEQLRAARRLVRGDLSRVAHAAREELADLLSLVEGALDFADEPIEFISAAQLCERLGALDQTLERVLAAGVAAERFGELPRVLLAGAPNAGKSSLLNRLTGLDRAICSPLAGTTRDVLTAPLGLGVEEALLLDVAGLDEPASDLDRRAQAAARRAAETADLVLEVIDGAAPARTVIGAPQAAPRLIVLNKTDLLSPESVRAALTGLSGESGERVVAVSARTGTGCDALLAAIREALHQRAEDTREPELALAVEQREALLASRDALSRAKKLAVESAEGDQTELVAVELHEAADRLAALVGAVATDELLGRIFARFCIGK